MATFKKTSSSLVKAALLGSRPRATRSRSGSRTKPEWGNKARWNTSGRRSVPRPLAVRDNRHDPVYLFGALCLSRATGAAIIMPAANSEAMSEHLEEIAAQVAAGAHAAALVRDGAGWHQRSGRLNDFSENITLVVPCCPIHRS